MSVSVSGLTLDTDFVPAGFARGVDTTPPKFVACVAAPIGTEGHSPVRRKGQKRQRTIPRPRTIRFLDPVRDLVGLNSASPLFRGDPKPDGCKPSTRRPPDPPPTC